MSRDGCSARIAVVMLGGVQMNWCCGTCVVVLDGVLERGRLDRHQAPVNTSDELADQPNQENLKSSCTKSTPIPVPKRVIMYKSTKECVHAAGPPWLFPSVPPPPYSSPYSHQMRHSSRSFSPSPSCTCPPAISSLTSSSPLPRLMLRPPNSCSMLRLPSAPRSC